MNKINRVKRLKLNTFFGLFYQVVAIICGFILPRLILETYGSELNGLVNSIQSILSIITLMEMGVGAVVQSALYKPLADNDTIKISKIIKAAKKYFFVVGIAFIILVICVSIIYPIYVMNKFEFFSTFLLIIAMSITLFGQYFLGIVNGLLVSADQKVYVYNILQIISLVSNTIICAILMKSGCSIQLVKFTTAIVFLIKPLGLYFYVKKNYDIVKVQLDGDEIPQKWNGIAQHIASYVLSNTDVIVLTVLSTLVSVSIYSTYHLITNSLLLLFIALTGGLQAYYGNLYALGDVEKLKSDFEKYTFLINMFTTIIFGIAIVVITPFVLCYTKGIDDANYNQYLFGALLVFAFFCRCIRTSYNLVILAAGHYKQTQTSAIVEVVLNILISVIFVLWLDLIGVAIGTIVAMLYRTVYFAYYCSKNIIYRKFKFFIKDFLISFSIMFCAFIVGKVINENIIINNYFEWIGLSLIVSIVFVIVNLLIGICFNKKMFSNVILIFLKKSK